MLKSSLIFKKIQTSRVNNTRILRINNPNFLGLLFSYEPEDIYWNFQICISLHLTLNDFGHLRLEQILCKLLAYFRSLAVFTTSFCFIHAKHF